MKDEGRLAAKRTEGEVFRERAERGVRTTCCYHLVSDAEAVEGHSLADA